jgi:hypothetical protein
LVAPLGPLLLAVTANVMLLPTFGLLLLTVLVTETLADAVGNGVAVARLLEVSGSVSEAFILALLA